MLDVSKRHSEHDANRQPHAKPHLANTPDEMAFEAEAIVDAIVDTLQSRAAVVTSMPTWAAVRRWHEYATVLLDNLDADNPTIVAGGDIAGGMADVGASACAADVSGRATIFQRVAVRFESMWSRCAEINYVNALCGNPFDRRVIGGFGLPQLPQVKRLLHS